MRKTGLMATLVATTIALSACASPPAAAGGGATPASGGNQAQADAGAAGWTWDRPVEFVVLWGPGSGTDTTMRAFAPFLEEELGVPVRINNVDGAGGIRGAEFFATQPTDGYIYSMFTQSHIIAAINQTANFDIMADTVPIASLVHDARLILAGTHNPFDDFDGMVEYARANPGSLTISVMSITGLDAISFNDFTSQAGIDITMIAFGSQAEADAAILGGHVDMSLTSPMDGVQYIDAGLMHGIVLFSEERSASVPDVPTTVEKGFDATIGPWRSIVAMQGTPEAAILAMEEAIIRANEHEGWWDWKESVGLTDRDGFNRRSEFEQMWHTEYTLFRDLMTEMGILD
ncbi:MAG: tripartite tricarboxylate transporter substrate binding protein [Defluviitaleaceae bacterium]|nr:tripartite tricarboxylate transporter substrate binding protein [Defluviitaleaceae bacterium]